MGIFERFLTIWVAASIIVGIILGELFPDVFRHEGNRSPRFFRIHPS